MKPNPIASNNMISIALDAGRSSWTFDHPDLGVRFASPLPSITVKDRKGFHAISSQQLALGERIKDLEPGLRLRPGFSYNARFQGCELVVEYAVSENHPFCTWRWSLTNHGDESLVLLDALSLLCANNHLPNVGWGKWMAGLSFNQSSDDHLEFVFNGVEEDLAIFLPGWQSWSFGGWVTLTDQIPRSRLQCLTFPMIYDRGKSPPTAKGHYRSEMFCGLVDNSTGVGVVFGFLTQREAFGTTDLIVQGKQRGVSIRTDLDQVRLAPGKTFVSDWACIYVDKLGLGIVDAFASSAGALNQARIPTRTPTGWCSWYDYGQAITEEIIQANLFAASNQVSQLPIETIQIDDGYQPEIGDWLEVGPHFSSGMRQTADWIKQRQFNPGLWLAPFIALANANVVRAHPDWVLKNRLNLPVNTGLVWNRFGRALDPSHPAYLSYLEEVISTVTTKWGYDYLKLDFLYAGVLAGKRYDQTRTRAQIFMDALRMIRETAGEDVFLVGCGCPLGVGIGIFDSMRIGPDVAPNWKPSQKLFTPIVNREPTLPAAVNAIHNTLHRAHFHRHWWINDPDCVLLRAVRSDLTLEEVRSLITSVGLSGGSLMLSDALDRISQERLDLFGFMLPPLEGRMQLLPSKGFHTQPVVMLEQEGPIGKWWLLACFNLGDEPHRQVLSLDQFLDLGGEVHLFNVWREKYTQQHAQKELEIDVKEHAVELLAIRQKDDHPTWIGDNVHLSQGKIIKEWRCYDHAIDIRIDVGRISDLRAYLFLPENIQDPSVNNDPISLRRQQNGLTVLEWESMDQAKVRIRWSGEIHDN